MARFDWEVLVRFRHCDPAGIIFYPRYFEMTNDLVETFFAEAVGWSFSDMHGTDRLGVPMGRISASFSKPSRVGDRLTWSLTITRLGGASADLRMICHSGAELRMTAEGTIVLVDLDKMKSVRWPEPIRARLADYVEEPA